MIQRSETARAFAPSAANVVVGAVGADIGLVVA
jgi:hypothetical protein